LLRALQDQTGSGAYLSKRDDELDRSDWPISGVLWKRRRAVLHGSGVHSRATHELVKLPASVTNLKLRFTPLFN
jgi:hypothetical protein